MQKQGRGGFTLLEVLIVVVISVMVTLFAVPMYKKSQDRNRYMAASGVLLDLGNAVRMLKTDKPDITVSATVSGNATTAQKNAITSDTTPTSSNVVAWLQANKYLNTIPFNGASTYMGYTFKLHTGGSASCTGCTSGIACMQGSNSLDQYTCAWVDASGVLHHK